MSEQIQKLTPNRDLQCYFLTPSAVAAMSNASASGFTLSGTWRQQFDWAVVEWTRDNTFEHPALRNLPDGDLSGLILTYQEERSGCIPLESNLAPVVDWNNLRIWATDASGTEQLYHVELWPSHATAIGSYVPASATLTLAASPGVGMRVGLAFLDCHHYWTVQAGDTLSDIAKGIAADVQANPDFMASSTGASVTVTWKNGPTYSSLNGSNGNRIAMYGFAQGTTSCWQSAQATFSGGQFPSKYQVSIDFGALKQNAGIPTDSIRKMRWTWAADMQNQSFGRSEFSVQVSNWSVSGSNAAYSFSGPASRRLENANPVATYSGAWQRESGNYSNGSIEKCFDVGASVSVNYNEASSHSMFLGTRCLKSGADVAVLLDGQAIGMLHGALPGEDVLVRKKLQDVAAGVHQVTLTHAGPAGASFYFDFLEISYPQQTLPDYLPQGELSLATDWDTYHSQSLPAERTAWMIQKLGFRGRVNHYVGALWFADLVRTGTQYAVVSLSVPNEPYQPNLAAILTITPPADNSGLVPASTTIRHLVLPDDTPVTIAMAIEGLINLNTNLLWATCQGTTLTCISRFMGVSGNGISVQLSFETGGAAQSVVSSGVLAGGIDGSPYDLDPSDSLNSTLMATADFWKTDVGTSQVINRAARDWHLAYFTALQGYGMNCVAAFSTELLNADPSAIAGLAQRYPDGTPVVVNTPAVQTNFSPTSLAFWQKAYGTMAQLQVQAGLVPYLQAGEVQWWYFPKQQTSSGSGQVTNVGMPFYDAYTTAQFQATYGKALQVITSNDADPAAYPQECAFLPNMIGQFTAAIRSSLQSSFPNCRFEVLYPTDTNDFRLNRVVNFATADWTPAQLTCLKTENFTFTGNCDLDKVASGLQIPVAQGFGAAARSHLVGISSPDTPWLKELNLALAQGVESVVLFALDQFCLVGYSNPLTYSGGGGQRRS